MRLAEGILRAGAKEAHSRKSADLGRAPGRPGQRGGLGDPPGSSPPLPPPFPSPLPLPSPPPNLRPLLRPGHVELMSSLTIFFFR